MVCFGDADAVFPEFVGNEVVRQGMPVVPMDERVNATPGAAGGNIKQPAAGGFTEVHRETGDHQEMIFLSHGTRLRVIFHDGGKFIAQIHLDDLLHVLAQFRELFFDLLALRPDAAVDVAGLVISQVHESGETLAESDGVNDGET
jgi:hypothetical protein